MGKQSAPAPPNYAPIAAADQQQANQEFQLGQEQLDFGKQQFAATEPYAQAYLTQQIASSSAEASNAQQAQQFYRDTYQPIEKQFADQAANYNTPANASQKAGNAMADVASTFDANRAASLSSLESYGIDPSQTRYGALDLGTRISQAAATAAAGTQSRLNTEATGMALQGEAINTGRGYASNVANAYGTATNAGLGGINAANSTTTTGVNSMGSPGSYMGLSSNSNAGAASALNMGFTNAMSNSSFQAEQSQAAWSGIGSLVGTVAGAALSY